MLQSLRNIWDIPDLRKRVLFTLGILAVYRLGSHVPTPGINAQALIDFFEQNKANWFGLVDMFSGGNMAKVTIFALGIMPYISASIILQLLTVVWPFLEKLSKEGELGKRKITQYTRYGTVLLSIVQSLGIAAYLENMTVANQFKIVDSPGWSFKIMTVLTLTTGTAFIMWLGEQITERGIGNGMSLIIFAGIVVGFPKGMIDTFSMIQRGELSLLAALLLLAAMAFVIAAIVFVERGQRRIPVQYAKRVVGRRMYGGQTTHLPLRVNTSGVIPVIFASSIIAFPQTIASYFQSDNPWMQSVSEQL
ncbi:MAG: preprotein translocase subunit SecY, partial [Acidobacteria bacterium]|nr:preprotein translocase subunit SecY [Acidobacteriota bacterium]